MTCLCIITYLDTCWKEGKYALVIINEFIISNKNIMYMAYQNN